MTIDPEILATLAKARTAAREATHDPVTGLLNRGQLQGRLARASRDETHLAVLIIDLDSFRIVNGAAGQAAGDALLAEAAERLAACANGRVLARSGDDEFTIVLAGESPQSTLRVASNALATINDPFFIGSHELHVTASIGIAEGACGGERAAFLMSAAAAALQRAKELGGNQCQHSSSALTLAEFEGLHVEHRLRQAIAGGELELFYQPQIRLRDGMLVGLEALLRWNRDGRLIPAASFIRTIERSSVIVDLGEWVINETCRQIIAWRSRGIPVPRIALNVGARHFQHPRFVETIRDHLARHEVEASAIELEITETTAMHDAEGTARTIDALRALGLQITIDDFGTGYSSLSYLKRFAVNGLKIDRAFVCDLPDSRFATAIINAIVAAAHSLDLRVVAEGVETDEQATFLSVSACDEAQGFLYARPIPANDIPAYLQAKQDA